MKCRLLAVLILISASAFGQQPANSTDVNSAFNKLLSAQYQKYRRAGQAGDVAAYLNTRTASVAKEMRDISGAKLKFFASVDFDPASFKFLRVEARPKSARTIWMQKTGEKTTYELVVYSLENGEWKIGNIVEGINIGDMSNVPGPTGLEQVLTSPRAAFTD